MSPLEYVGTAVDALASNKIRSFLTMLGVIIGVASVILLVAIGEGAKTYVRTELMGIGSNLLAVTPGKTETSGSSPHLPGGAHKLTVDDLRALEKRAPALSSLTPVVVSSAPVKYANRTRNVLVVGTDERFEDIRNLHVEIGSFITRADVESRRRVAVIGRTVWKELFRSENPLGRTLRVADAKFRVVGIMERKGVSFGQDIDDLVFLPVETAQELFDQDSLTEILAQVAGEGQVESAREQIKRALVSRHSGEEDFTIVSQQAMLETAQGILNTLTGVLGGIASISLVVGGIGIMNIMLVSVRERTREIGLRKAIGAAGRDIRIQFLIESVTLSLIGGAVGILLGVAIAHGVRAAFPVVPVDVSAWSVGTAFLFSFTVGVFFGLYPAVKAARLNPIEALRTE